MTSLRQTKAEPLLSCNLGLQYSMEQRSIISTGTLETGTTNYSNKHIGNRPRHH